MTSATPPDDKVVPFKRDPYRVTPEMMIRFLMSNMDKMEYLAFACQAKDGTPMILMSSACPPSFLTLAASIFDREAMNRLPSKSPKK